MESAMKCPPHLGLFSRARVMQVLQTNLIRVLLPCDSEIDLVLADCFPPPLYTTDDSGRAKECPRGIAAYRAAVDILDRSPQWLRLWLPVSKYDREWFRNLKPCSKQPGYLWITPDLTLNEYLVQSQHATRDQALPGSALFDGYSIEDAE
jgi:hypothetical protein